MTLQVVQVADPPPGLDWTAVVPGINVWDVQAISARVTTKTLIVPAVAVDSSGNGHDGAYTFGLPIDPRVPGCVAGDTAIDFTQNGIGAQGRVTIPAAPIVWAGPFTIEVWVQDLHNIVGTSWLVSQSDGIGFQIVELLFDGGPNPFVRLDDAGGYSATGPANTPPGDNLPHHIVATRAGGVSQLYVDGVAVPTAIVGVPPGPIPMNTTMIGAQLPGSDASTVVQDEVAIYAHALTAGQVAAHYAAGLVGFAAYVPVVLADGPALYYHLDDGLTTGDRTPILEVTDGTHLLMEIGPGFPPVLTGTVFDFSWIVGAQSNTQVQVTHTTTISTPRLLLPGGYSVGVRTPDLLAGDQWSQVTVWWDDAYQQAHNPANDYAFPGGVRLRYHQETVAP
jgi:hypothetical protein